MNIRPEEISSIIKNEIENYKKSLDIKTSGSVLEVGDGIARIYGLSSAMSGELLEFPHGVMGMALNLEEDNVGAVILGDFSLIKEGDEVKATGRVVSVPADDAASQRRSLQRVNRGVVGIEFESDLRVAERDALELGLDLRSRRSALVQETAARRDVVKEVAHEELRPHGTHHGILSRELPAVDLGLRAHLVARLPRAQFDLRHGGDRSQGLAAESERMQGVDVLHSPDLARGMAVESHACVDGRHAAAVVHNLDQILAAVAEIDFHGGRTCVDGVFHHLLHHRGGSVDDLARGDLVGDDLG